MSEDAGNETKYETETKKEGNKMPESSEEVLSAEQIVCF